MSFGESSSEIVTRNEALTWYLAAPLGLIAAVVIGAYAGVIGSQNVSLIGAAERSEGASLRTNVSETCQASMIELHGQEAWDTAVAEREAIQAAAAASNGNGRRIGESYGSRPGNHGPRPGIM